MNWLLDEALMREFFNRGGGTPAHEEEMRAAIDRYLKLKPDTKDIGFISVENSNSTECGRWMVRPFSLKYMPMIFETEKPVEVLDVRSLRAEKVDFNKLKSELFLDLALTKLLRY